MSWLTHAAARVGARVGRRGYTLLVLGIFDELYALSIPAADTTRTATARWLAHVLPLDAWAALWAAAGIVLVISAFLDRDQVGFATAELLKAGWALVYLVGWIWHDVYRAWVSFVVWTLVASWLFIISTWPEKQWPGPAA